MKKILEKTIEVRKKCKHAKKLRTLSKLLTEQYQDKIRLWSQRAILRECTITES